MTVSTEGLVGHGATSFSERIVAPGMATVAGEGARAGFGLLFAAVYGLGLGTREGGAALWQHAFGVPMGLASVVLVGVPSLYVFLSLADAPISPTAALSVATRSLGVSGLLLAGLAPATALFVLTIDSPVVAAAAGLVGLVVAGGIGLVHLLEGLSRELRQASPLVRSGGNAALAVFSLFAAGLCLRVWWGLLPLLGGAP
ncbi:MAG: hypothetical protein JW751_10420 [Polyangiaceae bacterium]|nr:hypothetical protein [Polyangiaceae bacterium]